MFLEKVFDSEQLARARIFLLPLWALCLPLHYKLSTILLLVLVAISLFLKKEKSIYQNFSFLLPPTLYLLIAISLLYSEVMEFRYLEQRASLIAFPIVFSTAALSSNLRIRVLEFFVWGCALAVFICFGNAFYNSLSFVGDTLVFKPVVNEEFSFLYSVVRDGNYFFSSHFSIFHQTTYFALFLNMAIAIILAFSLWKKKKAHYFFLVLFSLVIFQLSSKIGLLICILIFIAYGLYRIRRTFVKAIFVTLILVVATIAVLKNPRTKIMVDTMVENGINIDPEERYGYTLRLMSWEAALKVISKNPLVGTGVGDTQKELNTIYSEKGYNKPLKEELNAHNQFLQIMLACGILGLLVIVGMLWAMFNRTKLNIPPEHKFFIVLFLIMITLSFLFESFLNRYSGISFFIFFYYLIITQKGKKSSGFGN